MFFLISSISSCLGSEHLERLKGIVWLDWNGSFPSHKSFSLRAIFCVEIASNALISFASPWKTLSEIGRIHHLHLWESHKLILRRGRSLIVNSRSKVKACLAPLSSSCSSWWRRSKQFELTLSALSGAQQIRPLVNMSFLAIDNIHHLPHRLIHHWGVVILDISNA